MSQTNSLPSSTTAPIEASNFTPPKRPCPTNAEDGTP